MTIVCTLLHVRDKLFCVLVSRHVWRKWWGGRGTYFSLFSSDSLEQRFKCLSWRDTQLVRHTHTHTHTHNEVAVITERFKFDCMDVNIFAWPKEKPLESFTSLVCVQEIHKPPSVLAFICCTGVPVGELVGKQILDFSQ